MKSAKFEDFLNKKWPIVKRFGLEGSDMMIPAVKRITDVSNAGGVISVVIGMAQSGRLDILANVCRSLETMLCHELD